MGMLWIKIPFEIFVLALNSTPTKTLGNKDAGIARLDIYKHVIYMRVNENKQLGLIIYGDNGNKAENDEVYE